MISSAGLLERLWHVMDRPESWVVGGWVRDQLLDRPSHDIDIVVAGDETLVKRSAFLLGRHFGVKAHLLGREPRSVWRIIGREFDIEIWALGDSSLEQDIRRRDFSCNALMWRLPEGGIIDLVGGVDDILNRRLRGIDRLNFENDPVRLLRASRFLAQLPGFELQDCTKQWIRELAPTLAAAPKERIGKELAALLCAFDMARGLRSMRDLGLMEGASPRSTIDNEWFKDHVDALQALSCRHKHPIRSARDEAGPAALFSVLVRIWNCPSQKLLATYAWPKDVVVRAAKAAQAIDEAELMLGAAVPQRREFLARLGLAVPALVAVGAAMDEGRPALLQGWRNLWRLFCRNRSHLLESHPLLSAAEVAQLAKVEMGPRVGELMRNLEAARIRGEIRSPGGARRFLLDLK